MSSPSLRVAQPWDLRPIRRADDPEVAEIIREVMTEHGCQGAGFAIHDDEVDDMFARYQGDRSGYYVVERDGAVHGGGGFAALEGAPEALGVCELRKMYFLASARGLGLGRAMLAQLLDDMRRAGFRRCYLETTTQMTAAQRLYLAAGFVEQPGPEGATGHHACDRFFSRAL